MSYYGSPNYGSPDTTSSASPQAQPSSDMGYAPQTGAPQSSDHVALQPQEVLARNHALLCSIGYLVLLPLGTLFARYTRTFTNKWFYGHATWQLLIGGPVIFAGWALGTQIHNELGYTTMVTPHSVNLTHVIHAMELTNNLQKIGIAVMVLYVIQLILGIVIHFFKPTWFGGRRPPQNYFHAIIGLAMLALAAYQVHLGLTQEWVLASGGLHQVPMSAVSAWIALIVIFWVLYMLGLALLPRQYKREEDARQMRRAEVKA
ncbi:hypothetical protein ONZ45_g14338 [Pleurotus djamor]|nr:hypothetical protein ONZ45_g14338 [Pleurotus djamor]